MGIALSDMKLTSSAFEHMQAIPTPHTGEGKDVSPHLIWDQVPDNTKNFAVICHDPDAPLISSCNYGFVHWVYYNIPADVRELSEGCSNFTHGINDFGDIKYRGPMPPEGHGTHHYYYWILALSIELNHPEGFTMVEFFETVESSTIGMNRLIGTYSRG